MGKEPHGPVGLGPLPLQELPQQSLHLAVPGVGAFHRLLCVESIERRSERRFRKRLELQQQVLRGRNAKQNKLLYLMGGASNDSAVTRRSARCRRQFSFLFLNKRERCAVKVELFVPLEITDADGDPQKLCVCCRRTQCFC